MSRHPTCLLNTVVVVKGSWLHALARLVTLGQFSQLGYTYLSSQSFQSGPARLTGDGSLCGVLQVPGRKVGRHK